MIKFLYIKELNPFMPEQPVITVAKILDKENNKVKYNYSICSPKDNFVKTTGKNIALERLRDEEFVVNIKNVDYKSINNSIMLDLLVNRDIPSFAEVIVKDNLANNWGY